QAHGPDDGAAELSAIEDSAGAGVDAKRPGRVRDVAGSDLPRQHVRHGDGRTQEAPLAGQLVEADVASSEQADLVRLETAVERAGDTGEAPSVRGRTGAAGGERNARPGPASRRLPVREVVVEHLPHRGHGPPV